eukprot:1249691-Pyramimonas_sp.AAC.3
MNTVVVVGGGGGDGGEIPYRFELAPQSVEVVPYALRPSQIQTGCLGPRNRVYRSTFVLMCLADSIKLIHMMHIETG